MYYLQRCDDSCVPANHNARWRCLRDVAGIQGVSGNDYKVQLRVSTTRRATTTGRAIANHTNPNTPTHRLLRRVAIGNARVHAACCAATRCSSATSSCAPLHCCSNRPTCALQLASSPCNQACVTAATSSKASGARRSWVAATAASHAAISVTCEWLHASLHIASLLRVRCCCTCTAARVPHRHRHTPQHKPNNRQQMPPHVAPRRSRP